MTGLEIPDMNCVPYKRKKFYLLMTIPLLALMGVIFLYLWSISPLLSIVYGGLHLSTCIFQAYCCEYQDCPYIGKFCPGIFGIIPSSIIAKFPIIKNARKSKTIFEISASVASLSLVMMVFFPLFWLIQLGIVISVVYLGFNIIYLILFLWSICPGCATRFSCPAGRFSKILHTLFSFS